ncbi:MAG TPA: PHP domain-containing protein [Gemmatimonas sp.]|uniref:PHP domain-containing protein n=1 Tax=Gemmatimonas sp. TaxID=1962908 RepID=UPI002EDB7BA5
MTATSVSVVVQQEQHQAGHSAATPAFVDLQVHTTASDGALAPAVVVQAAHDAQLAAISITDHDTVDGLDEATAAGAALGVRIVPGVELSTHFENEELHLLGLHIANRDAIRSALQEFQAQRVVRAERIVAVLNAHGIPITMESVLREAAGGAVGRPHVARAMLAGGWVREFREAFDKWIGFGRPAYMAKDRFEVVDAIALVHRAGGLAVWAHPGELATIPRIRKLVDVGLDGVEVLHPSHPPYLVQRLFDHVTQLGVLPSGGSDWHGTTDGPRKLGGQQVPKSWLAMQDAVVASRLAAV